MEPLNGSTYCFSGLWYFHGERSNFDSKQHQDGKIAGFGPRVGSGIFLRNSSLCVGHASPMRSEDAKPKWPSFPVLPNIKKLYVVFLGAWVNRQPRNRGLLSGR